MGDRSEGPSAVEERHIVGEQAGPVEISRCHTCCLEGNVTREWDATPDDFGRIAAQTTDGTVTVATDCIYEADCASGTFVPGDLVTAFSSGAAAAGAIEDQKIDTTALAAECIGVVVKQYATATTKVWVRLYGKSARQVF